MKYHDITKDDMKNGDGLRCVLWVSGCSHGCKGCQNPITWDPNDGLDFKAADNNEILTYLNRKYVSGLTLSGGDPLFEANLEEVLFLCMQVKALWPDKTVWLYTGYIWEDIVKDPKYERILKYVDVLVDGEFVEELKDATYPWAGSTNQRVIDVQPSIKEGKVILHESYQEGRDYRGVQSSENCKCCS